MAPKRKIDSTADVGARPKRRTGLDLFRKKFISDNKDKYQSDFVRLGHQAMVDSWNALSSLEKEEYKLAAKRERVAEQLNAGIPRMAQAAKRGPTVRNQSSAYYPSRPCLFPLCYIYSLRFVNGRYCVSLQLLTSYTFITGSYCLLVLGHLIYYGL